MLFVLIYDRAARKLVKVEEFSNGDREAADSFRIKAQRRALDEHLDQEIVLFQSESLESLMRSHGSYFLTERELMDRAMGAVKG